MKAGIGCAMILVMVAAAAGRIGYDIGHVQGFRAGRDHELTASGLYEYRLNPKTGKIELEFKK